MDLKGHHEFQEAPSTTRNSDDAVVAIYAHFELIIEHNRT